jgi:hypothetical protein
MDTLHLAPKSNGAARPAPVAPDGPPSLRTLALAALGHLLRGSPPDRPAPPEVELLHSSARAAGGGRWHAGLPACVRNPSPDDAGLVRLAGELALSDPEVLAVALAAAVEDDALTGRAVAHLQAPVGGSRPTVGLLAAALDDLAPGRVVEALLAGVAVRAGLLTLLDDGSPMPERPVAVPPNVGLGLRGVDAHWPGALIGLDEGSAVPLPPSLAAEADRQARGLLADKAPALVVRAGTPEEGRSAAAAVARALGGRPVFLDGPPPPALAPWLVLRGLVPVFTLDPAPGERKAVPAVPYYRGPCLAVCGPDGAVESAAGGPLPGWALPVPPPEERRGLWEAAGAGPELAAGLARDHRHGCGRIAQLGRLARHRAALAGRARPDRDDVTAAARAAGASHLDALAQPLLDPVPDEALVVPATLWADLELLLLRCRARETVADGLGVSTAARWRPGVRALLVGPSGTGKTLAAGWLATRLGLPLYRVDLASVTSKYIGETEKNLARLLARAEQAEVVLLFDEADSLFGKRTEVREANDRFANAQTNYLLQRIEAFDGITLLTSNSRGRFDTAFARRLDAVLEFPLPGPEERRALWLSHLGTGHRLTQAELNRLAATADLAGGHVRNAVLTAAVLAREAGRPIDLADITRGLAGEYKKLGRQLPVELPTPPGSDPIDGAGG